jgi:hypothetical protein
MDIQTERQSSPVNHKAMLGISAGMLGAGVAAFAALTALVTPASAAPSAPEADGRLRIVHAAPVSSTLAATQVDIRLNGVSVLTNVAYGAASNYLPVLSEVTHTVTVHAAGDSNPFYTTTIALSTNVDYTALALGGNGQQPFEVALLQDDNVTSTTAAKLRVIHAAPFAAVITDTRVDIKTESGIPLLNGVPYKADSGVLPITPQYIDLRVMLANSTTTAIDVPPLKIEAGDLLTVIAIGDGVNQPLRLLPLGNYRALGNARARLVHAAPFSPVVANTSVTITVATPLGSASLPNVTYGQFTTNYLTLIAGIPTTVTITPRGASAPALTTTLALSDNVDYTVAAVGNGTLQPLQLLALIDDSGVITTAGKVRIVHAAPFSNTLPGTQVDVRTESGAPITTGFAFRDATGYTALPVGIYDLKVTLPGGGATAIDVPAFKIAGGENATVFAIGDGVNQPLSLLTLGALAPAPSANVFVAHMAPFSNTLNGTAVTIDVVNALGSRKSLSNVRFGQTSGGYLPLIATVPTTITVTPSGASAPVLTASLTLSEGTDYTVVALGNVSDQPLELMTLIDDNTVITTAAKLRLVHVAPFSANTALMLVNVRKDDGASVYANLPYKGDSGYLQLPGGLYDLKVFQANTNLVIVDPPVAFLPNGHVQTIFVIGDNSKQPFGVSGFIARDGRKMVHLPLLARN